MQHPQDRPTRGNLRGRDTLRTREEHGDGSAEAEAMPALPDNVMLITLEHEALLPAGLDIFGWLKSELSPKHCMTMVRPELKPCPRCPITLC